MILREATLQDYPGMHMVRMAVKENVLNNPDLVTQKDYEEMIISKGKGWVYEINRTIAGFSIIDLSTKNIWALFVHPDHEKKGIGKKLFERMMNWGFAQGVDSFWLSTAPHSRAEQFYKAAGWIITGTTSSGETRFEITRKQFKSING